jgi:hypothetical protein
LCVEQGRSSGVAGVQELQNLGVFPSGHPFSAPGSVL